jgi:hypothetical protein
LQVFLSLFPPESIDGQKWLVRKRAQKFFALDNREGVFYDHNIAEVGISGSYDACIAYGSARLDDKDGSGSSIPATS